jgi:hypothetical protein
MRMAIEENREQRRRSDANRAKAIAFDIDITNDKVEPKNMKILSREEKDREKEREKDKERGRNFPKDRFTEKNGDNSPASDNSSARSDSNSAKRRGWGPPVDGIDILQARRQHSETKLEDDTIIADFDSNNSERSGSNTDDMENGKDIMKKLEMKRRSQVEVRNEARQVLTKLREQRQLQAKNRGSGNRFSSGCGGNNDLVIQGGNKRATSPLRARAKEVLSAVEIATESVNKALAAGGINNKERRNSESKRSESPFEQQQQQQQSSSRASSNNSRTERENNDVATRNQSIGLNRIEEGQNDDELMDTVSTWLEQQKRAVTVRKKPSASSSSAKSPRNGKSKSPEEFKEFPPDEIKEDDDIRLYKSVNKQSVDVSAPHRRRSGDSKGSGFDSDFDSGIEEDLISPPYYGRDERGEDRNKSPVYDVHRPLKGKYVGEDGDDVEVVGMQCMLAKALMGDDDD